MNDTVDINYDELTLQRALQEVLADPERRWTCTNGDVIQIVAMGIRDPSGGPDFRDTAILHDGVVHIGDTEVHIRASDWNAHGHDADRRYASLLLHVVVVDDLPRRVARWTLVPPADLISRSVQRLHNFRPRKPLPVDELQHHALLRLLRSTVKAGSLTSRLGSIGAVTAMCDDWVDRLHRKRRRPLADNSLDDLRRTLPLSTLAQLISIIPSTAVEDVVTVIEDAERHRIATEGLAVRRELFVNCILPVLCSRADDRHRIPLLQWYWSARAVHTYGHLRRRFPGLAQDYVWQQQGMLEFLRETAPPRTVCADIIRNYGLERTLDFLRSNDERITNHNDHKEGSD